MMKALILLIVCSFAAANCHAQVNLGDYSRINMTDTIGRKQGLWIERFDNGAIETVMHYKDNTLNGVSIWLSRSGELETYSTFANGKKHGISRAVEPLDGTVRVTLYDQGVVQLVNVFDPQGTLVLEEFYSSGAITKSVHHTPSGIIEGHPYKR